MLFNKPYKHTHTNTRTHTFSGEQKEEQFFTISMGYHREVVNLKNNFCCCCWTGTTTQNTQRIKYG